MSYHLKNWKARDACVYFNDGGISLQACGDDFQQQRERAALMAAAPLLLEALQPFIVKNSSEPTITVTLNTVDIDRARRAVRIATTVIPEVWMMVIGAPGAPIHAVPAAEFAMGKAKALCGRERGRNDEIFGHEWRSVGVSEPSCSSCRNALALPRSWSRER